MTQLLRALWLLVGIAALGWLCARFGLADVGAALNRVNLVDAGIYVCAAVAVLLGYSVRWQLVLRAMGARLPLGRLVAARLAGDAVGALVPGGKVGGDPVRVALIVGNQVTGVRASAGVAIDRVLELIGNCVCAIVCVSIFSLTRTVGTPQGTPLLLLGTMVVPLLALVVIVCTLRAGRRPFTPLFESLARAVPRVGGVLAVVRQTEDQLIEFFRDHPTAFVAGLLGSLLIELVVIVEYHFLLAAFGMALDLPTLLMTVLASGLSRVVPTPAGLGALEASEVTVLGLASGRPEVGFVVGMVMRLHETLWTTLGMLVLLVRGTSFARLRVLAARKAAA